MTWGGSGTKNRYEIEGSFPGQETKVAATPVGD